MKTVNYIPIIEEALKNIGIDAENVRSEHFGKDDYYSWIFQYLNEFPYVILIGNIIYVSVTLFEAKVIELEKLNFYRDLLKLNKDLPGSAICINKESGDVELKESRSLNGLDAREAQEIIESVCNEAPEIIEKMKFKYDLLDED